MTEQVYSFLLDSRDKIAGDNNTAIFNVMFSILPREYRYYKVGFSFYTDPAIFVDTYDTVGLIDVFYSSQCGRILTNLLLQNSMKTNNSPSNQLGFITRSTSVQNTTATNHICYICADKGTNQEIVVLRPDVDQISLTILAGTGLDVPLVTTNTTGTLNSDCPPYILHLQFTPVKDFHTMS
jgi:hypothetical protein